jgi:hypothetical protein
MARKIESMSCGDQLQRAYEVRRDGGSYGELATELECQDHFAEWLMYADNQLYAEWLAQGGKRSFFAA